MSEIKQSNHYILKPKGTQLQKCQTKKLFPQGNSGCEKQYFSDFKNNEKSIPENKLEKKIAKS